MQITKKTGEYIVTMASLAGKNELPEITVCKDCDRGFDGMIEASRDHGVMRLGTFNWTIIIGCEGFHQIEITAQERK